MCNSEDNYLSEAVDEAEKDGAEKAMAQAYVIMGNVLGSIDVEWTDEIEKMMDYLSDGEYDEDFLPWDCGLRKDNKCTSTNTQMEK